MDYLWYELALKGRIYLITLNEEPVLLLPVLALACVVLMRVGKHDLLLRHLTLGLPLLLLTELGRERVLLRQLVFLGLTVARIRVQRATTVLHLPQISNLRVRIEFEERLAHQSSRRLSYILLIVIKSPLVLTTTPKVDQTLIHLPHSLLLIVKSVITLEDLSVRVNW